VGHAAGHGDGTGTGLANMRARLRELYGDAHAFELSALPAGGALARVRIPFREQSRFA
jgi:LytS/YehU family sensor histidine kinase